MLTPSILASPIVLKLHRSTGSITLSEKIELYKVELSNKINTHVVYSVAKPTLALCLEYILSSKSMVVEPISSSGGMIS